MQSHRVHAIRFVPTEQSRHFVVFDSDVPLITRIEFMSLVGSHVPRSSLNANSSPLFADLVELQFVCEEAHPAHGQLALFAKTVIPPKTILGPYTGVIRICQGMTSSRTYAMSFGENDNFAVDGEFAGGYARFANDPRNTGRMANVIAESRVSTFGEPFTALITKRTILEGEEILMDYGKAFSLDPRPWIIDGSHVTRSRVQAALPCVACDGKLVRECPSCGFIVSVGLAERKCEYCDCPLSSQNARSAVVSQITNIDALENSANRLATNLGQRQWWPQSVVFLPWQIWDPLVPLSSIACHTKFKVQETIALYEASGDIQVVAARSFLKGNVVCFVGGTATFRSPQETSEDFLHTVNLSILLGLDASLFLHTTNEARYVRLCRSSKPNVMLIVWRENNGSPCIALQALRNIDAFEELWCAPQ